jgi:L-ribulokinase
MDKIQMRKGKYALGVDFGTLSGRAVIVDVDDGKEMANAVHEDATGVIDGKLPDSAIYLQPDWALQDPNDSIEVFKNSIPALLAETGIDPTDIIGSDVDVTACSILPTIADGTPLCLMPEWRDNPHPMVKLCMNHASPVGTSISNELIMNNTSNHRR